MVNRGVLAKCKGDDVISRLDDEIVKATPISERISSVNAMKMKEIN